MTRAIAGALIGLVVLTAAPLHAQRRGGSFGGSRSFGSSSSRRSSVGSRSSRRSRAGGESYRSRSGSTRSGSSGDFDDDSPRRAPPSRAERAASPPFSTAHVPPPPEPPTDDYERPEPRPEPWSAGRSPDLWTGPAYPVAMTAPSWETGGIVGLSAFAVLGLLGLLAAWNRRRLSTPAEPAKAPPSGPPPLPPVRRVGPEPSTGPCEVRRLSFAYDWTQRATIQTGLERMAGRHDPSTAEGMHRAATEARDLLLKCVSAAQYATFQRYRSSGPEAESRFARLTTDLRARFSEETVRQAYRREYGELRPRREEGEGLVVVSLVLGSIRHLPELPTELDRDAVQDALSAALPSEPDDLVALEVIWSPSDDSDRMSSAELEMFYPELQRLDDAGPVGRVACDYCRAPFPRELQECPGCGAPAP